MVSHWLHIHDLLKKDLPHLQSAVLFQYELMMRVDPSDFLSSVLKQIDILPGLHVETADYDPGQFRVEKTWTDTPPRQRHPLEYHGSRAHVTVQRGSEYLWVEAYEKHMSRPRHACTVMLKMYEARVNEYGYSLHRPRSLTAPAPFAQWYVKGYANRFPG